MRIYDWHTCPAEVREQVDHLVSTLSYRLDARLVGIYLHGSLAMGCFNPRHSDLDVLVITAEPLQATAKRQIVEYLLARSLQPRPIEISLLARSQLWPWRFPTPFDLHYSEMWRAAYTRDLAAGAWQVWGSGEQRDPDLAAHITVLNARGIRLAGAPIAETFPAVPDADYRASLADDIRDSLVSIANDPVYAILNCCRTYAYLQEGHILSKAEGGDWALQALSADFHAVVAAALAAYRSETDQPGFDPQALGAFACYMRQELAPVLGRD